MDGSCIRKARKLAKVDQTPLAEKLGMVSRGTLTDIEAGVVDVTDAWAFKAIGIIQALSDEAQLSEAAAV